MPAPHRHSRLVKRLQRNKVDDLRVVAGRHSFLHGLLHDVTAAKNMESVCEKLLTSQALHPSALRELAINAPHARVRENGAVRALADHLRLLQRLHGAVSRKGVSQELKKAQTFRRPPAPAGSRDR